MKEIKMKKMMVTLRSSEIEELRILVDTIYTSLKKLFKENPDAFYDVVATAKNNYEPCGNNGELLCQLGFINKDHIMHDSTRNIILSSIGGDMLELKLVNPIIEE